MRINNQFPSHPTITISHLLLLVVLSCDLLTSRTSAYLAPMSFRALKLPLPIHNNRNLLKTRRLYRPEPGDENTETLVFSDSSSSSSVSPSPPKKDPNDTDNTIDDLSLLRTTGTSPPIDDLPLSRTGTAPTPTINDLSSIFLLTCVTLIWGTQHAVTKTILMDDAESPSGFTFARFLLGLGVAVWYSPPVGGVVRRVLGDAWGGFVATETKEDEEKGVVAWRWGVEMGTWMFLGYAFQAIGLEFTTAQRSGFLLYLNVKFVPFFAYLLLQRRITIPTWISALTAFLGTALLSYDGSAINIGDVWSVAAAAASAMFILRMESASRCVESASALNAACLWTVTAAAGFWLMGETYFGSGGEVREVLVAPYRAVVSTFGTHPFAILYLGVVAMALSNYIQAKAQRGVTAERASIVYAMDPVYGAVFAYFLLGETLGGQGVVGAGLITLAAATNAFLDLGSKEEDEDTNEGSDEGGKLLSTKDV